MDFTLLGKPMTISEGRKNYLKILRDFQIMGKQAEADFRAEYDDRFGLVIFNSSYAEKFINTYGKCDSMDKLVKQYVSKARQYLMGYGVYTLTDEAIWNEAIITEDRSVSRSQYEFNSFFVDCLDSEQTDDVIVPRIKSKFEGSFFPTCLYNDVMALFDYVVGYLDDNKIADIQFVYKKDAEQAKAVYQNLKDTIITDEKMVNIMSSIPPGLSEEEFIAECERRQGPKIPQEEKARLAFSLINLDPRKEEYFHLIFDEFPLARYEIVAIAQYLNMDMSNKIARDLSLRFDPNRVTNEEQALQMLKELQDAMDKYGQKTCAQKDALVKLLQDFDVKARTYGGILYETREQKAQAESASRKR